MPSRGSSPPAFLVLATGQRYQRGAMSPDSRQGVLLLACGAVALVVATAALLRPHRVIEGMTVLRISDREPLSIAVDVSDASDVTAELAKQLPGVVVHRGGQAPSSSVITVMDAVSAARAGLRLIAAIDALRVKALIRLRRFMCSLR